MRRKLRENNQHAQEELAREGLISLYMYSCMEMCLLYDD